MGTTALTRREWLIESNWKRMGGFWTLGVHASSYLCLPRAGRILQSGQERRNAVSMKECACPPRSSFLRIGSAPLPPPLMAKSTRSKVRRKWLAVKRKKLEPYYRKQIEEVHAKLVAIANQGKTSTLCFVPRNPLCWPL